MSIISDTNATTPSDRAESVITDESNGNYATVTNNGFLNVRTKADVEDDVTYDMTSRLKTAEATQLFAVLWNYTKQPNIFSELVTGSATVAAPGQTDPAFLKFQCTTSASDSIRFQTKRFLRYQPYREHELNFSFIFGTVDANQDVMVGQYTTFNGWYWKNSGGSFYVGYRNSSFEGSGTIETNIAQADWNFDKLDGTGPSELDFFSGSATLSLTNTIVFYIRYVWHGGNGIEFGVEYFNRKIPVHRVIHSGSDSKPFARSAILPFRLDITNNGVLSAASTQYLGPISYDVHGGAINEAGYRYSYAMGNVTKAVTSTVTYTNILAVRCKSTINSINNRGILTLQDVAISASDQIYYEVLIDCEISGGTWVDVGQNSITEQNVGAFTYTGGRQIDFGYVSAGQNANDSQTSIRTFAADLFAAVDTVSNVSEAFVIRAIKFSGNANVSAGMGWKEIY